MDRIALSVLQSESPPFWPAFGQLGLDSYDSAEGPNRSEVRAENVPIRQRRVGGKKLSITLVVIGLPSRATGLRLHSRVIRNGGRGR